MDNEWMEIAIDIRKRVIYYKDDIISFKEWFTDYMKTRSSTPAAEVKDADVKKEVCGFFQSNNTGMICNYCGHHYSKHLF